MREYLKGFSFVEFHWDGPPPEEATDQKPKMQTGTISQPSTAGFCELPIECERL